MTTQFPSIEKRKRRNAPDAETIFAIIFALVFVGGLASYVLFVDQTLRSVDKAKATVEAVRPCSVAVEVGALCFTTQAPWDGLTAHMAAVEGNRYTVIIKQSDNPQVKIEPGDGVRLSWTD